MMTRKDYVATAEILNDFYLDMPIGLEERFDEMVNGFAKDVCSRQRTLFIN